MTGKRLIPREVGSRTVSARVMSAIDFDTEACLKAGEIECVRAERMLPPELEAFRSLAEFAPQDHLGQIARSPFATR